MNATTEQSIPVRTGPPVPVKVFAHLCFAVTAIKLIAALPSLPRMSIGYNVWNLGGMVFIAAVAAGLLCMRRWAVVLYFIGTAVHWTLLIGLSSIDQAFRTYLKPGLQAAYLLGVFTPIVAMLVLTGIYWKKMK